jgi:hypothetical protein
MGWCPYWNQNRNDEIFKFNNVHPGAERRIEANLKTGIVLVKRRASGFGSILNSLHFFNETLPQGSWIINSWKYFKNSFVFYIIITVFSSSYFFLIKKKRVFPVLICLCSALMISTLLMVYLWQIG